MKPYLSLIDTDTPGRRCDVTPLFADAEAFAALTEDLAAPFREEDIDYVAGIDALGFVLGAALARHLQVGFIPIRKGGKLPVPADREAFIDYTGESKSLELRTGAIQLCQRVLLVDEWIETGAQVHAAITLIERAGGAVAGIAAINIDENALPVRLCETYHCHSLI